MSARKHSRDPRARSHGDGSYSMAHMLPWTHPASDWMAGGKALVVALDGPGHRWGKSRARRVVA